MIFFFFLISEYLSQYSMDARKIASTEAFVWEISFKILTWHRIFLFNMFLSFTATIIFGAFCVLLAWTQFLKVSSLLEQNDKVSSFPIWNMELVISLKVSWSWLWRIVFRLWYVICIFYSRLFWKRMYYDIIQCY